jgi:hypothetical protein
MLKIRADQMRRLGEARTDDFMRQALRQLRSDYPNFCGGRDDAELRDHLDRMLAFCSSVDVRSERGVMRLTELHASTGYSFPPAGYLAYRLTQPCFDEATRVANFEQALSESQHPVVITLDTVLPSEGLRRE